MKINRLGNVYTLMLQIGEPWVSSTGSQALGIEADSYTGQKSRGRIKSNMFPILHTDSRSGQFGFWFPNTHSYPSVFQDDIAV